MRIGESEGVRRKEVKGSGRKEGRGIEKCSNVVVFRF